MSSCIILYVIFCMSICLYVQLYKKTINNERMIYRMLSDVFGEYEIHQVAGFIARTTVPFVQERQTYHTGEPLGMIRFGSRVDIRIPKEKEVKVHVKLGDCVDGVFTKIASCV